MNEIPNVVEEEPPSSRESIQHASAGRLSNGSVRSNGNGAGVSRCLQLVYIHLAPGYKPYLGYHNSTNIYQDDETDNG